MVMGDVQSGKTASYAGLMAKAADAGYRNLLSNCFQELGHLSYLDGKIDDARRWYALMAGRLRTLAPV